MKLALDTNRYRDLCDGDRSIAHALEQATDARAAVKALTELTTAGGAREAGWIDWEDVREEWAGEPSER